MLFGRLSPVQQVFNGYDFCKYISTQLIAPSLKVSSHANQVNHGYMIQMLGRKSNWKVTKINYNWPY